MVTLKKLTVSEEAIMQIIWKLGQGFAQDIMSEIPEPKPPYNTTLSVVKALERKGYVGHETFAFTADHPISDQELQELERLVQKAKQIHKS